MKNEGDENERREKEERIREEKRISRKEKEMKKNKKKKRRTEGGLEIRSASCKNASHIFICVVISRKAIIISCSK